MALCFALGSACFLIGPFPGYIQLVGTTADGLTFFVGSILFTAGGALQSLIAWPDRTRGAGRAAWWSAIIQSAGTLFFNVTTVRPLRRHPHPLPSPKGPTDVSLACLLRFPRPARAGALLARALAH